MMFPIFEVYTVTIYSVIVASPILVLMSRFIFKVNINFAWALRWSVLNEILIIFIVIPLLKIVNEDVILWKPIKFVDKIELLAILSLAILAYLVPFCWLCMYLEKKFFNRKLKFIYVYTIFFVVSVFIPFIMRIG